MQAETKDALLHAINEEYVEAVEVLLDHEESIHLEGEPWSWETLSEEEAVFSTDMTPLVLAAHTNNYEIIKILLDRGAVLPCPHHQRYQALLPYPHHQRSHFFANRSVL